MNGLKIDLRGRVAIVNGSSRGLGKEISRCLALAGANVSMGSIDTDQLEDTAESIRRETGSNVISTKADIRNEEDIRALVVKTLERFGRIDILVTNGGGPPAGDFEKFTDEDWQSAYELLLLSVIRSIRAVLPTMKKQEYGRILALTSSGVQEPLPSLILSNTLRSGVAALVKSLSDELAPYNILINTLIPGRFGTQRVDALDRVRAQQAGVDFQKYQREAQKKLPLGRYGDPHELAAYVAFLVSDLGSYVTGSSVRVDGGLLRSV